jgi:hypothetical protein
MALFAAADHAPFDLALATLAARTCLEEVRVLAPTEARSPVLDALEAASRWGVTVERCPAAALPERLGAGVTRLRCVGAVPEALLHAAAETGVHVERGPVLHAARVELLAYLEEQSVSVEAHRFGMIEPALPLRGACGATHERAEPVRP